MVAEHSTAIIGRRIFLFAGDVYLTHIFLHRSDEATLATSYRQDHVKGSSCPLADLDVSLPSRGA